MKILNHSTMAMVAAGLVFADISGAVDLDGTVFAQNQHRYQTMSQSERSLAQDLSAHQQNSYQHQGQFGGGRNYALDSASGERHQTRSRNQTQSQYASSASTGSGYGSGYGTRQGGGNGGGRGRH